MTKRIDITPAPEPLEAYAEHFDDLWEKSNQREAFRRYLEGLLLPTERHKTLTGLVNTEPVVGAEPPRAQKLHWFLSESTWDERKVQAKRLRLLRDDPSTAPTGRGVLVIDETGDRKDGHQTAHVSRQYLANLGKIDNGVVSVSSLWADERVYYPIDVEPSTPALYFREGKKDPAFRTKLKIALQLVQRAIQDGMPFRAVVADSLYGEDRGFRSGLRELKQPYVLALKPSHAWWHPEDVAGTLQDVAHEAGWVGECPAARQLGAHQQDVSRWQHAGLVGRGDRGWALWASQARTRHRGHHRSTDAARHLHLVPGDQPARANRAPWNQTAVPSR
jgi:SRSO17 transposase